MSSWRSRRPPYYEVKCVPGSGNSITLEQSGWKAWAQLELYYYLLGKGYSVGFEQSEFPPASSLDLTLTDESDWDKPATVNMLKIKGTDELGRDTTRFIERTAQTWAKIFLDLNREADGGAQDD